MTDENQMIDRRKPTPMEGWHLDKKVPISLIGTLLTIALAGIWQFSEVKRDIELIKQDVQVLHQRDKMQADQFRDAMKLMQEQFVRLDTKLDRLIEKQK